MKKQRHLTGPPQSRQRTAGRIPIKNPAEKLRDKLQPRIKALRGWQVEGLRDSVSSDEKQVTRQWAAVNGERRWEMEEIGCIYTLKGDRKSEYSIRINDQWRICFRFENGNVYDAGIEDYH